jgi:Holliday junction resolvase RusA-like endonuclease
MGLPIQFKDLQPGWFKDEVEKKLREMREAEKAKNNIRVSAADTKQKRNRHLALLQAKPIQAFDGIARITFTHARRREADFDNLWEKGVVDGIVKAGILKDDGPRYLENPVHKQLKIQSHEEEFVLITIEEI